MHVKDVYKLNETEKYYVKVRLLDRLSSFTYKCEPVDWTPDRKNDMIYYLELNPDFVSDVDDIIRTHIDNLAYEDKNGNRLHGVKVNNLDSKKPADYNTFIDS